MLKRILLFNLFILLAFISCQRVDRLNDADKIELIKHIIKEEKIDCVYDKPDKLNINDWDSALYYISLYPSMVQKNLALRPKIKLSRLFNKRDIDCYNKQISSFDSTIRYNELIKEKVNFIHPYDTLTKCNPSLLISYPLINSKGNAMIVLIHEYSGPLSACDKLVIYAKKNNKWIKIETIMLSIS
jgi:hypothetical protein